MCGIVGAVRAKQNVVDFLTDGLKRLEYRGYDSSGIAVGTEQGVIERVRRVGRVQQMEGRSQGSRPVRPHRHRPHPLGYPRRRNRAQCASAYFR